MTEGPKASFPAIPETAAGDREGASTERQQVSQVGREVIATSPAAPAPATHGTREDSASDGSKVARVGIVAGLSGILAGFVLGYRVGLPPASSSDAPIIASATSASPANPSVPAGPTDLVLDLGTDEAQRALQGAWTKAALSQRSVALASGPGSIEITLNPAPSKYGLAVVAKTNGIGAGETLVVTLSLNRRVIGVWKIGADWDMHALVLEATSFTTGRNVLDLVLAAGKPGAAVAIDTLHVAPLSSRAEAGMATLEPRGSFIDGYYGKEGEGAQASTWSAGLKTRIGLLLAPLNAEYDVQLDGAAFGPLQPLDVEVIVNSKSVGIAKVDKGPRYVFHAPPGAFTPGLNIVELVYPKTLKPSDSLKGSNDQRDLAIRIAKVMAAPAATPMP